MNRFCFSLIATVLAIATLPAAMAQDAAGNCIVAGRLGEAGWAPRMRGVALLGANGQAVLASDRQALAGVRQVRLSAPALLSRCDGNNELAVGDETPAPKTAVPALRAGVHPVEAVHFPRLRRSGELVELRVTTAPDRLTTLMR